jgi:hypothetical protein
MTFLAVALIIASVGGAYWLADYYVCRSMRSFQTAEDVWHKLNGAASELLTHDIPESVSRMVVALTFLAGCGCFVRGVLIAHYLPRVRLASSNSQSQWEQAFNDLGNLDPLQRSAFERLLGFVIIYDSFKNPFQGWLFRRVTRSFTKSVPSFKERAEAQLTALDVLSRRNVATH